MYPKTQKRVHIERQMYPKTQKKLRGVKTMIHYSLFNSPSAVAIILNGGVFRCSVERPVGRVRGQRVRRQV